MEKKSTENQAIMHDFSGKKGKRFLTMKVSIIFLIVILFGIGSGYLLATKSTAATATPGASTNNVSKSQVTVGQVYGSNDTSTYKDTAEGTMKSGGMDGEGQYHLERPGGVSQNVYLTSSTVDLSVFVGHKVKVWGQTQASQTVGWLMDVGRVQVEQ